MPLNARVTDVVEYEGYRIEKVHFESRPDYHVTANLDVPTASDVLERRANTVSMDLIGVGRGGPVALHAAALDDRFVSVSVRESISSWVDDLVARPLKTNLVGHVVRGRCDFTICRTWSGSSSPAWLRRRMADYSRSFCSTTLSFFRS